MFTKSESVELKRKYTPEIRRTLAAFANSNGGTVYIGVGSEGSIVGVIRPEAVISAITNIVRESIKPSIFVFTKCEILNINDTKVVAVKVQRGTRKPYFLADKGMNSEGVFIRTGAVTSPATDNDILDMLEGEEPRSYEMCRSLRQNLTFNMLEKVLKFKNLPMDVASMQKMGIFGQDELYTNLALLLSDQSPHGFQMTRFSGKDSSNIQDSKEITGSVLSHMKQVCEFIGEAYPRMALQELVINAVLHRDYSRSVSTKVNIYSDRLEMISYGGIYADGDVESVRNGLSICRNPKLMEVFRTLGVVRTYGAGIKKVEQCYEELALKPEFTATSGVFKVVLPSREACAEAVKVVHEAPCIPPVQTVEKIEKNVPIAIEKTESADYVEAETEAVDVQTPGEKVVEFVRRKGLVTRPQVEEMLGVSLSTANRILKALERDSLLECVGKGRNTKYRINRT